MTIKPFRSSANKYYPKSRTITIINIIRTSSLLSLLLSVDAAVKKENPIKKNPFRTAEKPLDNSHKKPILLMGNIRNVVGPLVYAPLPREKKINRAQLGP